MKTLIVIYLITLIPSFLIARAMEKRGWISSQYLLTFLKIWISSPIAIPHCLYKVFKK